MLLDSVLIQFKQEIGEESTIEINDYLINPNNGTILKEKINFKLYYFDINSSREMIQKEQETQMKSLIHSSHYQLTAIDLIKTIKRTGEFAINNFSQLENFDKLSIRISGLDKDIFDRFKSSIGNSRTLLKLAINILMTYELSYEYQELIRKYLNKNNLVLTLNELCNINEFHSSHNNLMNQFFKIDHSDENSLSWQIRIRIIEIKSEKLKFLDNSLIIVYIALIFSTDLIGFNENVQIQIQIGESFFKTKSRHIDKLQFNNGDDNQVIL